MDVLTPFQVDFLRAFARTPLNSRFHLTGGTALAAFYLRHRLSEDLDFFTSDGTAILEVPAVVMELGRALRFDVRVERSLPHFFDADLILPGGALTKVDFAVDSPFRLKPLLKQPDLGIELDAGLDIAWSCSASSWTSPGS